MATPSTAQAHAAAEERRSAESPDGPTTRFTGKAEGRARVFFRPRCRGRSCHQLLPLFVGVRGERVADVELGRVESALPVQQQQQSQVATW